MSKLVTIAIPVYKSLNYLPNTLQAVEQQDYSPIEVIISDNGMNGPRIAELVDQYYSKPYKLRQNLNSVDVITHFNQLIDTASGEYFVLLCDDDEISENYISELVNLLEQYPQASAAISKQDVIDASNNVISSSINNLPSLMSGGEFLKLWCLQKHGFKCFITYLARTELIKKVGRYPNFPRGFHSDNSLLAKLCLTQDIAFSQKCTFRWRKYGASNGDTSTIQDLTEATKQFLSSLECEPTYLGFAHLYPDKWRQFKQWLVQLAWSIYLKQLTQIPQGQVSTLQKLRSAFYMPHVPKYYAQRLDRFIKDFFPELYKLYQLARHGGSK